MKTAVKEKQTLPVVDPEFQNILAPLPPEEYAELEADILARGCRIPLDVWNGILVDGHNRFKICTGAGVPFETKPIEFEDRRAARIWIRKNQMLRRNIPEFVRVELGLENEAEIAAQAKERQGTRNDLNIVENLPQSLTSESKTRDVIGKAAGVSGRTVDKVKKIKATGTPELQQAVRENKVSISAAAEIATLPAAKQIEVVAKDEVTIRATAKAMKATHVANNSGENEWYTPPEYIEAAREVMGSIDVDPASSDIANRTVKAETYYTAETNGLAQAWRGNVWLNPPYERGLVDQFAAAVASKYTEGEINQAIVLVNNATDTEWCQTMMAEAAAVCLVKGRIKFLDIKGNAEGKPLQGQMFIYFGQNSDAFINVFSEFGKALLA